MKFSIPDWYVKGQNPWYVSGRFLKVGQGNNSFSLPNKDDRCPLEITPLKVGSLEDLRLGKNVAFQDFEDDKWLECIGLESGVLCLDFPIPIYIFDNHNHVFYAWAEALKMGWFEKGATLVHMDEHFDAGEPVIPADPQLLPTTLPSRPPDPLIRGKPLELRRTGTRGADQLHHWQIDLDDLENVWNYTNEVLQIATYIKPALKLGIFSECVDYVESKHFEMPMRPPNPLKKGEQSQNVLNLDIDVFHEDMSHISWQEKIGVLKYYLPQTKLITIATSPYFIDQQKAIQLVKKVVRYLLD